MTSEIIYVSQEDVNRLLQESTIVSQSDRAARTLSEELPSTQITIDITEDFFEGSLQKNTLLDLLKDFKLAHAFDALSSCGFTFEKLKFINSEDLEVVFPGKEHTALKAELREKINTWKVNNFPSEIPACHCRSKVLQWVQTENISRESTPISDKINYSFNTRVIDILKSTKAGENLLTVYSNKHKLEKQDRKKLLNCLVEYFFEPYLNRYEIPSPRQQDKIAEEIVQIFPTETKETYFVSRKKGLRANPSGLLFNRLSNINRKRKNSDDVTQKIDEDKEESVDPSCDNTAHTTTLKKKRKLMQSDEVEVTESDIKVSTGKY